MTDTTWTSVPECKGLEKYEKRDGTSYRLRVSLNGERPSFTIEAPDDATAIGKAWILTADLKAGRRCRGGGDRLRDLLDRFEVEHTVAASTMSLYLGRLDRFAGELDERPLHEITTADVRRWLLGLKALTHRGEPYSANSLHGVKVAAAALFSWATRFDHISTNPFRDLDRGDALPRSAKAMPRAISLEEADALADAVPDSSIAVLLRFAVRSALRSGELRGLQWSDIDIVGGRYDGIVGPGYQLTQQVGLDGEITNRLKTQRSGWATGLVELALEELLCWQAERPAISGLVFPTPYGAHLNRHRLRAAMDKAAKKIGIAPLGPHVLRHSAIMHYRDLGASQSDLAAFARDHPQTLNAYYSATSGSASRLDALRVAS